MRRTIDTRLRNGLDNKGYLCPRCKKSYSTLEVAHLLDLTRNVFVCDVPGCGTELIDNEDAEDVRQSKDTLTRFNEQLGIVQQALRSVEGVALPPYVRADQPRRARMACQACSRAAMAVRGPRCCTTHSRRHSAARSSTTQGACRARWHRPRGRRAPRAGEGKRRRKAACSKHATRVAPRFDHQWPHDWSWSWRRHQAEHRCTDRYAGSRGDTRRGCRLCVTADTIMHSTLHRRKARRTNERETKRQKMARTSALAPKRRSPTPRPKTTWTTWRMSFSIRIRQCQHRLDRSTTDRACILHAGRTSMLPFIHSPLLHTVAHVDRTFKAQCVRARKDQRSWRLGNTDRTVVTIARARYQLVTRRFLA